MIVVDTCYVDVKPHWGKLVLAVPPSIRVNQLFGQLPSAAGKKREFSVMNVVGHAGSLLSRNVSLTLSNAGRALQKEAFYIKPIESINTC